MAINFKMAVPALRYGLQRFGIFSAKPFSTSLASFKSIKLSQEPIERLQLKAAKKPKTLSKMLKAAQQVLTAPMIFASDVETTGAIPDDYGPHTISALGLVGYSQGVKELSFDCILNPGRPCSTPAITMHGLQSDDLKKRKTFEHAIPKYLVVLQLYQPAPLGFHDAAFEKRVLKFESDNIKSQPQYRALFESTTIFCSYQLALTIRPKLKNHNTLDQLCNYYGINNDARKNGHGEYVDRQILMQMLLKLSEDVIDKAQAAGVLDDMLKFEAIPNLLDEARF